MQGIFELLFNSSKVDLTLVRQDVIEGKGITLSAGVDYFRADGVITYFAPKKDKLVSTLVVDEDYNYFGIEKDLIEFVKETGKRKG